MLWRSLPNEVHQDSNPDAMSTPQNHYSSDNLWTYESRKVTRCANSPGAVVQTQVQLWAFNRIYLDFYDRWTVIGRNYENQPEEPGA